MSIMQELESTSTLFGGNIPFIEEQYEKYLADPGSVAADWRGYFDTPARRRARRGARAGDRVVHPARQEPPRRRCDGGRYHHAQAGAGAAAHKQVPHPGDVPFGSRSPEAPGESQHPRPGSLHLWLQRRRHGYRVRRRLLQGRPAAHAPRRPHRGSQGHLLPHLRRGVHVHIRHVGEALRAGIVSSRSIHGRPSPRSSAGTSSSASPRPRPSSATCTPSTSGRSASRSRAARP